MNQSSPGDGKKVAHTEEGNGWNKHQMYVLEKLDDLCDGIDKLKDDNAAAHKTLHDKMDVQKTMCANRPIECQKQFLPTRTFGWLVIVLIVMFGTSFSLSGTALKQNAEHEVSFAEYKTAHSADCNKVKEKIDSHLKDTIMEHRPESE